MILEKSGGYVPRLLPLVKQDMCTACTVRRRALKFVMNVHKIGNCSLGGNFTYYRKEKAERELVVYTESLICMKNTQ